MFAYNHERYVARAMESVLMQQTPFAIELVIGEDCSPDGTRPIVQRIAATRGDVVRPIFHPENVGAHANYRAVVAACRGEFIAFLDGDDFWLSPDKLARQVETLEQDPSAVGCFHRIRVVDQSGADTGRTLPATDLGPQRTRDLLIANQVPTVSVLMRRSALSPLPARFNELGMGDWPTWLFATLRGPLIFLPETLAAYREHASGTWTGLSDHKRLLSTIALFEALAAELPAPFGRLARRQLAFYQLQAAEVALHLGDAAAATLRVDGLCRLLVRVTPMPWRRFVSVYVRTRWPGGYRVLQQSKPTPPK